MASNDHAREARNAKRTEGRIPTKTAWALQDIKDECAAARRSWNSANDRARGKMDPVTLLYLVDLRRAFDTIGRKASEALQGRYVDD